MPIIQKVPHRVECFGFSIFGSISLTSLANLFRLALLIFFFSPAILFNFHSRYLFAIGVYIYLVFEFWFPVIQALLHALLYISVNKNINIFLPLALLQDSVTFSEFHKASPFRRISEFTLDFSWFARHYCMNLF